MSWLNKITQPGVRRWAELMYQQLDGLSAVRHTVRGELLAESRKHEATKILRQIPLIGPLRATLLLALMQTPHRFEANDSCGPTAAWRWRRTTVRSIVMWMANCNVPKSLNRSAAEPESQPRAEGDLQEYGHERQSLCRTTGGFLRRDAGQGNEAGYGMPHARTEDRGYHANTLEERRMFRRRTLEIAISLGVDGNQAGRTLLPRLADRLLRRSRSRESINR